MQLTTRRATDNRAPTPFCAGRPVHDGIAVRAQIRVICVRLQAGGTEPGRASVLGQVKE